MQPKITGKDLDIVKEFEGFSLKAYADPATGGEPYTISWGLTGPWVKKGLIITQEEAERRFDEYVAKWCKDINALLKVPLSQNQYIALFSLAWNIGIANLKKSSVLRLINEGKPTAEVAQAFMSWTKAGGKVMKGLVRRRQKESKLFLS